MPPVLPKSEHMPPPGPAPSPRVQRPALTQRSPRKKAVIAKNELVHFTFGGRSKARMLDDLEPLVWQLAKSGYRKPGDVARLLNRQGVNTACGEPWTPRLAQFLLEDLFERDRLRKDEQSRKPSARGSDATHEHRQLTAEEMIRRLSALGRIRD